MQIVVTVKQVPDPDIPPSHFKVDESQNRVVPPSGVAPVMNGYDANALEAALKLKEAHGGEVTVVSVGPAEARDTLKRALAMGATNAIQVSDPLFGFAPQVTRRSAPVVIGAAFARELFVDGAAGGTFVDPQTGAIAIASGGALESQAVLPPQDSVEMSHPGRSWTAIATKLAGAPPLARASQLPASRKAAPDRSARARM